MDELNKETQKRDLSILDRIVPEQDVERIIAEAEKNIRISLKNGRIERDKIAPIVQPSLSRQLGIFFK